MRKSLIKFIKSNFHYSPETGLVFRNFPDCSKVVGGPNGQGYLLINIRLNKRQYAVYGHQIAWLLTYGYVLDETDHINQIKTDNRLVNLRKANRSQNQCNKGKNKNNQSGYKGVYWHIRAKSYYYSIKSLGKTYCKGGFNTDKEAMEAYDIKCKELHDEFACPNVKEVCWLSD